MTQPQNPTPSPAAPSLQLKGGAAIVAPVSAFPGGIPQNALVVVPITKPTEDLEAGLKAGPMVVTQEQMWSLLGFNGPAVQVTDAQGRPLTIGLDDLLDGLRTHYQENKADLTRARLFAGELMKYRRFDEAEKVLARLVASGGTGEDWVGLGVAQLQQKKLTEAESTLKGARNLLATSPVPSLHLAQVHKLQNDREAERAAIEHAISVDPKSVDAWALLYMQVKDLTNAEQALAAVNELADTTTNKHSAAPFVALQGILAGQDETREQAMQWAKKAVERDAKDPLALVSYTALLGQAGRLDEIVTLLAPVESAMMTDARLANNYFEALFHKKDIQKLTQFLNKLGTSSDREVKQFAIERSRFVAQFLQQQQQKLAQSGRPAPSGLVGPSGQPL
jgi:tetratricopeptide (TPR) repeat protein